MFPDVERGLVLWAMEHATDLVKKANTVTPKEWVLTGASANVPYLQVAGLGGPRDGVTGAGTYDLNIFAPTRNAARDTCEALISRLRPRLRVGSAIIDTVTTRVSPRQLPWENPEVVKFSATLVITTRR